MDIADQIKDKLPLADWLQGRGLKLVKQGHTLIGLCPFHTEKTGSFVVWPDQDRYYCFGCGQGGDLFTYYQQENRCDFKEALKELAREAGVELRHKPEELAGFIKTRERAHILSEAVEHYRRQLGPQHREYLNSRGFNDEFIDTHRFGFAPGGTLRKALSHLDTKQLQEIGLINHEGRDFFWNRIIIAVIGPGGEVVNLAGRAWDKDIEPKYLRLPGASQLINEQGLRKTDVVYLCEGEIDTLTVAQLGLPVVGVGGSKNLQNGYGTKFKNLKSIYVCGDGDEAGKGLALKAGELLGNRCRIVELPGGEDINSWVGQKGNDLAELARGAKPFLDYIIEQLPTEIEVDRLDETIKPVLIAISQIGKASQEAYLKRLSKKCSVGVVALRESLRELTAEQETESEKQPNQDDAIVWRNVQQINPAQDFYDGTMYATAFLDVLVTDPETDQRKLETIPYIVTSKRELFPLTDTEAYKRGLRINQTKIPMKGMFDRRWSIDANLPYSVKSYLDDNASVSPWEVYTEVVSYFRQYVDYPNDLYYEYLALWTIGTYWYNLYPAYPYTHLTGTKRVGKSLTLQIVGELAFNALFSSSMTAAAAFRAVESNSTTVLMDEAENLQKKSKDNDSGDDKIEILKSGYMKGPKAIRCSGDNHEVTTYDVYSPKMFGSVQALDRILADRAVTLILTRKKRQLPEFNFQELKPKMAATRDKLYVLMLERAVDLMEVISAGIQWDGVKDRERQLWTPVLTLAGFFDQYQADEVEDIKPEDLLTSKMRELATVLGEAKLAKEQSEQTELLILEGLLDYLKEATPIEGHFYPSSAILEHLKQLDELSWLSNARQIIRELEKVAIIQNKNRDVVRKRIDGNTKQIRVIRLELARVQEIAQRYGAVV